MADKIRQRAMAIKFDDGYQAKKICGEARAFITEHKNYVNHFLIEGIDKAEITFSEMSETKIHVEKEKLWKKGIEELIYVLQSIRNENSYPA